MSTLKNLIVPTKPVDVGLGSKKAPLGTEPGGGLKDKPKPLGVDKSAFQKSKSHAELILKKPALQFLKTKERPFKFIKPLPATTRHRDNESESLKSVEPINPSKFFSKSSELGPESLSRVTPHAFKTEYGSARLGPHLKKQDSLEKLKKIVKLEMSKSQKAINKLYHLENKPAEKPISDEPTQKPHLVSPRKGEPEVKLGKPYNPIKVDLVLEDPQRVQSQSDYYQGLSQPSDERKEQKKERKSLEAEEYVEYSQDQDRQRQKHRYTFQGP